MTRDRRRQLDTLARLRQLNEDERRGRTAQALSEQRDATAAAAEASAQLDAAQALRGAHATPGATLDLARLERSVSGVTAAADRLEHARDHEQVCVDHAHAEVAAFGIAWRERRATEEHRERLERDAQRVLESRELADAADHHLNHLRSTPKDE